MPSPEIHKFFRTDELDVQTLSTYLDQLEGSSRIQQIRSLRASEQAMLFNSAKDFLPITIEHFIPTGIPALQEVVHFGRNSLPVLFLFEKRFCLPELQAGELWGYNEQPIKGLTGPGYFIARPESEFEFIIDYNEVPRTKPTDWPPILPNSPRLSRFIYYRTRDYVRRVSDHVTIGRATRDGEPLNNWFVLCRS